MLPRVASKLNSRKGLGHQIEGSQKVNEQKSQEESQALTEMKATIEAQRNDINALKLLVNQLMIKIDKLSAQGPSFNNMLLEAARDGNIGNIQFALKRDADILAKNAEGQTALHLAVMNNHLTVGEFLLLDNKLTTSQAKSGLTLFSIADNHGVTPIQHAAQCGNIKMFRWLYQTGKKIDGFDGVQDAFDNLFTIATNDVKQFLLESRLLESAITGNIPVLKEVIAKSAMIENGLNINVRSISGHTALHYAVSGGYIDVTSLLLEYQADPLLLIEPVDTSSARSSKTALDLAAQATDTALKKIVATAFLMQATIRGSEQQMLLALDNGADIMAADRDGQLALHKAVLVGDINKIKCLLKKHVELTPDTNLSFPDKNQKTPCQLAEEHHRDIAHLILQKLGGYKKAMKHKKKEQEKPNQLSSLPVALGFVATIGQGTSTQSTPASSAESTVEQERAYQPTNV